MERPATVIGILLLVLGAAVGTLYIYYSRPEPGTARIAGLNERARVERFTASFDSLTDARLYPMVWRAGTFLRTSFNDDRSEWTLTVSSGDWGRRNAGSTTSTSTSRHPYRHTETTRRTNRVGMVPNPCRHPVAV